MDTVLKSSIKQSMDVISMEGEHVGSVDSVHDKGIDLAEDSRAEHDHRLVPFNWVDHVDRHVRLNRTMPDIKTTPVAEAASEVSRVPNKSR